MAKLAMSIEIAAPPDRVGVFFVPQRMPYWYGAEMQAEFTLLGGEPDFRASQMVQVRGTLGKREVALTAVVTEYDFARVLEWRFQDAYGVKGRQRWEIQPAADGSRLRLYDAARRCEARSRTPCTAEAPGGKSVAPCAKVAHYAAANDGGTGPFRGQSRRICGGPTR